MSLYLISVGLPHEMMLVPSVVCIEADKLLLLLLYFRTVNVNMRNLYVNMPERTGRFMLQY